MAYIKAYEKFINGLSKKSTSKLGNKKCEYKGMKFDSTKECRRYKQLELLQSQGYIHDLKRQTSFELQPKFKFAGQTIRAINYVSDFDYYDKDGHYIVEDVKASPQFLTPEYKLKAKIFKFKYGFAITEVYEV